MYKLLNFNIFGDHNGSLIALEEGKEIPFNIKRVYYIWGTAKEAVRGRHAHKELEQVVVCVSGSCDFILDDGEKKVKITLSNPSEGLYLSKDIWREFTNFSDDCVVMVLASELYNEADYIRSYEQFINYKKANNK